MARPRTPTAILEARGVFKAKPSRRRRDPDSGKGIGPAPASFTEDERAMWDEVVGDLAPGVLQSSDRHCFGQMVRLLAESRRLGADFGSRKLALLLPMFSRFGMTPADRAKLAVPVDEDEDAKRPKVGLASFRR